MPFTPFHLGPAAAIKVFAGGYFSFMLFGFTQVIIDLESLYYLIQKEWPVHRFLHTYVGATTVLIFSYFVGKPICEFFLKAWNTVLSPKPAHLLYINPKITRVAALSGTTIGVYSHVLLDSIMHSDITPFSPFTDTNSMLNTITVMELHIFCIVTGVFGAMTLLVIFFWNKWTYDV